MVTRGSPKPLLWVRILLPLPEESFSEKEKLFFYFSDTMAAYISSNPSPYKCILEYDMLQSNGNLSYNLDGPNEAKCFTKVIE